MRVKALIKSADPVPEAAHEPLSARAAEELAALVGSDGTAPSTAAHRSPRRGLLMAVAGCGAAAAVGGVILFGGLHGGPSEPGEGPGRGVLADAPYYGSTAELEGAADVIVRARLGAGREEVFEGVGTTVATAEVVATAKGGTAGDSLQVSYTAPGSGPETAGLTAGQEYVLLLERGGGGRYFLVSTTQGWYEVEDGAAVAGRENEVALSPGVRKALRLAPGGR